MSAERAMAGPVGNTSIQRGSFEVRDEGDKKVFPSGMMREVADGKVRYDLVLDGPLVERLARHLTKGAAKYKPRNWMQANSDEEIERARESAFRHFLQWWRGDIDEDHFAATVFNMNLAEYVGERMTSGC